MQHFARELSRALLFCWIKCFYDSTVWKFWTEPPPIMTARLIFQNLFSSKREVYWVKITVWISLLINCKWFVWCYRLHHTFDSNVLLMEQCVLLFLSMYLISFFHLCDDIFKLEIFLTIWVWNALYVLKSVQMNCFTANLETFSTQALECKCFYVRY